jgi:hypothetical protein
MIEHRVMFLIGMVCLGLTVVGYVVIVSQNFFGVFMMAVVIAFLATWFGPQERH